MPVTLIERCRSDRAFYAPAGARRGPTKGRSPRHGTKLVLPEPGTHPETTAATANDTAGYRRVEGNAFARMHPKLESRGGRAAHIGALPIIEGTVVGLRMERLPGDRDPKPVWLWTSKPVPDNAAEVDHWWSMFIRRFDLEHTFRFLKQTLGWTRARLREPAAADRWTWLIIAAHTQLRLPWQRPLAPAMLTAARVRVGSHRIYATAIRPTGTPKPARCGPGRLKKRNNRLGSPIQPGREIPNRLSNKLSPWREIQGGGHGTPKRITLRMLEPSSGTEHSERDPGHLLPQCPALVCGPLCQIQPSSVRPGSADALLIYHTTLSGNYSLPWIKLGPNKKRRHAAESVNIIMGIWCRLA